MNQVTVQGGVMPILVNFVFGYIKHFLATPLLIPFAVNVFFVTLLVLESVEQFTNFVIPTSMPLYNEFFSEEDFAFEFSEFIMFTLWFSLIVGIIGELIELFGKRKRVPQLVIYNLYLHTVTALLIVGIWIALVSADVARDFGSEILALLLIVFATQIISAAATNAYLYMLKMFSQIQEIVVNAILRR